MSEENNMENGGNGSLTGGMNRMHAGGRNNMPWVVLAVVVLLIVLGVALFRDKLFTSKSGDDKMAATAQEEKLSGYQAVFLTNGQVYFGKLSDSSANYATLTDIYYLQVAPQPALQGSQSQQTQQQQQQLLLVKLGKELHGPQDEMKINRTQILFFEDIKESGTVMTKIREYQKNPPKDEATAPAATPAETAPAATPATTPKATK